MQPERRGPKPQQSEPKVLLVETEDSQEVRPQKVQDFVQDSFDPKDLGLKKGEYEALSQGGGGPVSQRGRAGEAGIGHRSDASHTSTHNQER